MTLDLTFFLFAVPAVIFAGISKGGFANGPAFAATPFLALVLEPAQAVALMLPLLMIMDGTAVWSYRGRWNRAEAAIMILAAIPGLLVGMVLFRAISPDLVRLAIGVVAIGFVAFQIAVGQGWIVPGARRTGRGSALLWGGLLGFGSFISHAGGPPASVYLLGRGLDKTAFQATMVLIFTVVNALKFLMYVAIGLFVANIGLAVVTLAPVAILGTMLGVATHRLVSPKVYFRLTYAFLVLTGAKLIFDAAS